MYVGTSVQSPQGTIEVSLVIDGVRQPLYLRPGDGKVFVVGEAGRSYQLEVRNRKPRRVEVIMTVDGRHTLRDEPGDAQRNRGLVFDARNSGNFTGWRLNDQQTRQFVFGAPERSIAAQATGVTSNVGVIGVAVYQEKSHLEDYLSRPRDLAFAPQTFGDSMRSKGGLGTGMGDLQEDRVGSTHFTRASDSPEILVIGYDTESVLREQGILGPAEPNPFPGAGTGYEKYAAQ